MNIYIHCEIVSRELDSKLLLAITAAAKGHEVLVSDVETIEKGVARGFLKPGIFHTKSLTPSEAKIKRHSMLIKAGLKITSIDEEGGLTSKNYDNMSKIRYSSKTINQSSAVFAWGKDDYKTLRKNFSKFNSKIYKTGSPRADLWQPKFSNYWKKPKNLPKKPYLLISSNMNVCDVQHFYERIQSDRKSGYFERDPNHFIERFKVKSNNFIKAIEFINAIKHLSKFNNGYTIVLRPHPIENVNCWKILLEGISNIHIVREGSIDSWLKNSFAIMHNGCTTALEAAISKKPVVTYKHPSIKTNINFNFVNQFGYSVTNKESLLNKINNIFNKKKFDDKEDYKTSSIISKKIFIDDKETAANKIIKIWEVLNEKSLSKINNWFIFTLHLKKMRFNGFIGRSLKLIKKEDTSKFPSLNHYQINQKVNELRKILGIKKKIECKLLSNRAILIR